MVKGHGTIDEGYHAWIHPNLYDRIPAMEWIQDKGLKLVQGIFIIPTDTLVCVNETGSHDIVASQMVYTGNLVP